jgi:MoaA/NifB/PqqE/SkfB family radical SAM enzyme
MQKHWDMSYLGVMVDMAGCPNRCRHCWLGRHRDGNMSVEDFKSIAREVKDWRDETGEGIEKLSFLSWWREPDYRDDYWELWELEQELSSQGQAQRFELLSTWRLARDEDYAKWAATLPPKVCQISFFGMEENTDWGMGRKGAFKEQITATERCLDVGIAPRWQLFLTKRCLGEFDEFLKLINDMDLHRRCERIGHKFQVFIGGISPEGNGYYIEDLRLEEDDLQFIPPDLISITRERLELLGVPKYKLLANLMKCDEPPNLQAGIPSLAVNADYDVYPNSAEPTEWWRLGNLKTDGVDSIIKTYRDGLTPGMQANRTIPLSRLAKKYGNPASKKLYSKEDLIRRFMHQWGMEHISGWKSLD